MRPVSKKNDLRTWRDPYGSILILKGEVKISKKICFKKADDGLCVCFNWFESPSAFLPNKKLNIHFLHFSKFGH
jgi:hypothetical protein